MVYFSMKFDKICSSRFKVIGDRIRPLTPDYDLDIIRENLLLCVTHIIIMLYLFVKFQYIYFSNL